jgi:hypothetical protein
MIIMTIDFAPSKVELLDDDSKIEELFPGVFEAESDVSSLFIDDTESDTDDDMDYENEEASRRFH